MDLSALLFYGGMAGMGITAFLLLTGFICFLLKRRKLMKTLNQEYGESV